MSYSDKFSSTILIIKKKIAKGRMSLQPQRLDTSAIVLQFKVWSDVCKNIKRGNKNNIGHIICDIYWKTLKARFSY